MVGTPHTLNRMDTGGSSPHCLQPGPASLFGSIHDRLSDPTKQCRRTCASDIERWKGPRPPSVTINALGLTSGELIRKTITGASGTPAAINAATTGSTPSAQKGLTIPSSSAPTMDQTPARSKKCTTLRSSLRAFMAAATRTEIMKNQRISIADEKNSPISARSCWKIILLSPHTEG